MALQHRVQASLGWRRDDVIMKVLCVDIPFLDSVARHWRIDPIFQVAKNENGNTTR
jgi:hypothetical protein